MTIESVCGWSLLSVLTRSLFNTGTQLLPLLWSVIFCDNRSPVVVQIKNMLNKEWWLHPVVVFVTLHNTPSIGNFPTCWCPAQYGWQISILPPCCLNSFFPSNITRPFPKQECMEQDMTDCQTGALHYGKSGTNMRNTDQSVLEDKIRSIYSSLLRCIQALFTERFHQICDLVIRSTLMDSTASKF